nr:SALMFamide 2 [Asterias rubens]
SGPYSFNSGLTF